MQRGVPGFQWPVDSNQGSSCSEATVLMTTQPCHLCLGMHETFKDDSRMPEDGGQRSVYFLQGNLGSLYSCEWYLLYSLCCRPDTQLHGNSKSWWKLPLSTGCSAKLQKNPKAQKRTCQTVFTKLKLPSSQSQTSLVCAENLKPPNDIQDLRICY